MGKGAWCNWLHSQVQHKVIPTWAVVALDVLPMLEEEARERQGTRTDIKEIIPESSEGQARVNIMCQNAFRAILCE